MRWRTDTCRTKPSNESVAQLTLQAHITSHITSALATDLAPQSAQREVLGTDSSSISPDDWDTLFRAVTTRLQGCVGGIPARPALAHFLGVTATVQTTVLECVVELNRLHAALVQARAMHKNGNHSGG